MSELQTITIIRKDEQDVTFRGNLVASISSREETRQGDRDKQRWTELKVWELPSGKWIAASIGRTERAGEVDVGSIVEIAAERPIDGKRFDAMAFWGFSWMAKELAKREGWDMVREII